MNGLERAVLCAGLEQPGMSREECLKLLREPRMRAYLKMVNFLTVGESLQLAAGIFNHEKISGTIRLGEGDKKLPN